VLVVTLLLAAVAGPATAGPAAAADRPLVITTVETEGAVERFDDGTWRVPRGEAVTVSGTSNREAGTTVLLELVRGDGTTVPLGEARVADGTWETTVDLSVVDPGTYTLRVTAGAAAASVHVEVVDTLRPPSETPFVTTTTPSTAPGDPTEPTVTASPSSPPPPAPTATPTSTPAGTTAARTPGFGGGTTFAAVAVVVAAVVAVLGRRP
jgi:hypothetical protein